MQRRKKWNDETAKRIHVAVRVRPMSINEIKADAKVKGICRVMPGALLEVQIEAANQLK